MTFEYTPTDDGFRIRDTVENSRTTLSLGRRVEPAPGDVDRFRAPLDDAITVETREIRFDEHFGVSVYDEDATHVTRMTFESALELDPGTYELHAWFPHFVLYFHVTDAAISAAIEDDGTRIAFDSPTEVTLGLRSFHERPAGTVTATQDPRELMRAVSTFGSGLKTLSPERSFPTLRGHPPELAIRGQTAIPDDLAPPDTGITVEVPPEYESIFTVAPLAYYLGATVEPGLSPRLVAGDAEYAFDPDTLATSVNHLLRHCVLLDCIVRVEGLYPVDLREHSLLQKRCTLDTETLYDLPIADRTARYLDVPTDATTPLIDWPYVADIDPAPLNAEALPYLSYRLAAIRSPPSGRNRDRQPPTEPPTQTGGADTRSFLPGDQGDTTTFVVPDSFDAQHHIWIGDGIPVRGAKPTLGAYLRSIDTSPKDETIEQHVVTVDGPSEREVRSSYRDAGVDPATIRVHEDPTTSQLSDLLMDDVDYLHYRGRVTSDGLASLDGTLDIRTLPRVGVSAFFLDATNSAPQGLSLIHAGGIGGVVTIGERDADQPCGCLIGALLESGFTMGAAASIVSRLHADMQAVVVGDGDHRISPSRGISLLLEARPELATPDTITVTATGYPTKNHRVGTIFETVEDADGQPRLLGTHDIEYTREQVEAVAATGDEPLLVDGTLYWLDDLSADDLWTLLR